MVSTEFSKRGSNRKKLFFGRRRKKLGGGVDFVRVMKGFLYLIRCLVEVDHFPSDVSALVMVGSPSFARPM